MAKINYFIRSSGENKTIYFRYRPNRELKIELATPYAINSDNWDEENQYWDEAQIVKGAKTAETKKRNSEIEIFNSYLT